MYTQEPKSPLFSILIANFNNGKYFQDTYQSIINQSYTNWEAIIVDDCSTDDSVKLIEKIIENDNRFSFHKNKENRGCGFTKNKCIFISKGGVLGFLDPDDTLKTNAIDEMVKEHIMCPDASLISSKYEMVDNELNFISYGNHGEDIPKGKSFLTYGRGSITAFATFKRKFYDKTVGIYRELRRAVDQDLYLKLEEVGNTYFINKYLYIYRQHSEGISQENNKHKARYWHFVTICIAYKRRKNNSSLVIDNFTEDEFRVYQSRYYVIRFKRAAKLKKYCSKYYFLLKAIFICPSHRRRYKWKAFFIYNYH